MMMTESPDCLQGVLHGDVRSIQDFVAELSPLVQRQILVLLARSFTDLRRGDLRDDMLDISQTVFVSLFERNARLLRRWDPARSSIYTYVKMIARSRTVDYLRQRRDRPVGDAWDMAPQLPAVPSSANRVEARILLQRALDKVGERTTNLGRQMLDLLFVQMLPVEEIRSRTGMTRPSIEKWKSRLRKHLIRHLRTWMQEAQPDLPWRGTQAGYP